MAFFQRARRMLGESRRVPLDQRLLLAALTRGGGYEPDVIAEIEEPLVELLTGGPDWPRAARAQGGCFSRVEAGRCRNAS